MAGAVIRDTTVTDIRHPIPTDTIGRIARIIQPGTVTIAGLTTGTMAIGFITLAGAGNNAAQQGNLS
jgi:hypothetical protein